MDTSYLDLEGQALRAGVGLVVHKRLSENVISD